jgi:hypothetical protein
LLLPGTSAVRALNKKMKKYTLSLIAIFMLMLSLNLEAQQVNSFWLNGVTGLNSNWILNQNAYGNPEMAYAPSFGFTGGVGASYFISKKWALNGSVLLSRLGQKYSDEQAGAKAERKVKLNYIEVPLLFMRKISFMKYPTWISAGPGFLVLLNAKQEYTREDGGYNLPNPDGMTEGDITERFNPLDIALNVSLTRMYDLNYFKSIMLLVSANSSFGLLDINSAEWQIPNTHNVYAASHNFYIGIKVGLMFKVARFGGPRW